MVLVGICPAPYLAFSGARVGKPSQRPHLGSLTVGIQGLKIGIPARPGFRNDPKEVSVNM